MPLNDLPIDMWTSIFAFFSKRDLARAGEICKTFYKISRNPLVMPNYNYQKPLPIEILSADVLSFASTSCLLVISPTVIAYGEGELIRIVDLVKNTNEAMQRTHNSEVTCLLKLDQNTLLSGSTDKTIHCWDIETKKNVRSFCGYSAEVLCMARLNKNAIVTGSADNIVRLWDIESGECLREFEGHKDKVNCIAKLNDKTFISGSEDCSIRIWVIQSKTSIKILKSAHRISNVIKFNHDKIISCSLREKNIKIWDLHKGKCIKTIFSNEFKYLLQLTPSLFVSGAEDISTLQVWDANTGKLVSTLKNQVMITAIANIDDDILCLSRSGGSLLKQSFSRLTTSDRDNKLNTPTSNTRGCNII